MIKLNKASITIVIPIHEGTEFIDDLLEAIRKQTVKADEIVFIISKVGKTDEFIKKLNLKNFS